MKASASYGRRTSFRASRVPTRTRKSVSYAPSCATPSQVGVLRPVLPYGRRVVRVLPYAGRAVRVLRGTRKAAERVLRVVPRVLSSTSMYLYSSSSSASSDMLRPTRFELAS